VAASDHRLLFRSGRPERALIYCKIKIFGEIFYLSDLGNRIGQITQMPPQELWARASAVLPPWVSILLVAAIAWQLARIVWLLIPAGDDLAAPPPTISGSRSTVSNTGAADIQAIVNAHLFGRFSAEEVVEELDPVDAPDTRLSLELRGTIAAEAAEQAMAIIAEKGGEEHVYAVGDAVAGGASLHSVYTDRVLLRRAGQLETLRLPRADEGSGTRRSTPTSRRPVAQTRTSTLREVINRNPSRITDVIRPQPVFKDGQQQGYRVYPGRQRQQFSQLGLRPGDLITQINGVSLNDPARGMEIFRDLGQATSVSVTIERNGQTEVLNLDTSQIQGATRAPGAEDEEDE
jgi:general secretion pathway protein C